MYDNALNAQKFKLSIIVVINVSKIVSKMFRSDENNSYGNIVRILRLRLAVSF